MKHFISLYFCKWQILIETISRCSWSRTYYFVYLQVYNCISFYCNEPNVLMMKRCFLVWTIFAMFGLMHSTIIVKLVNLNSDLHTERSRKPIRVRNQQNGGLWLLCIALNICPSTLIFRMLLASCLYYFSIFFNRFSFFCKNVAF